MVCFVLVCTLVVVGVVIFSSSPDPPPLAAKKTLFDIIVVGAGFAGIGAARALQDSGRSLCWKRATM